MINLCNRWDKWIFKILIGCIVHIFIIWYQRPPIFCFSKRGHGYILFIYVVDYLSKLLPLHKVEPFLSKMLKLFHQIVFVPYRGFSFQYIVLELIKINFLELILWNIDMNWRGRIFIYLYPPSATYQSPLSLEGISP